AVPPPAPAPAPALPDTSDLEKQLKAVQDQLSRAQTEKAAVEAKLKEAVAAQRPSGVEAQQLTAAEEKIQSIQKDNETLKANLEQLQAKTSQMVDTASFEQVKQALAEANSKLARQSETVTDLTQQ